MSFYRFFLPLAPLQSYFFHQVVTSKTFSMHEDGADTKMKIAFINEGIYEYATDAPDAVGGLERDQWLLARTLAGHGWNAVVGVMGTLKLGERKTIDGVDYVGLRRGQILLAWRRFLLEE